MDEIINKLKACGVGRRKLHDNLFSDKPSRLGIYDVDDEQSCHCRTKTTCTFPGCNFKADSLMEIENHYNSTHRFVCSQCKKCLPTPYFLHLHIQELHDSFFSVLAAKKPSYSCYIEECKEKFMNSELRLVHCLKMHGLPKDFRFDQKPKQKNKNKNKQSMDIDNEQSEKNFSFNNNKQRGFKKFTNDVKTSAAVNMDAIMEDIKESLP